MSQTIRQRHPMPVVQQKQLFKDILNVMRVTLDSDISSLNETQRRILMDAEYFIMAKERLEMELQRAYEFIAKEAIGNAEERNDKA